MAAIRLIHDLSPGQMGGRQHDSGILTKLHCCRSNIARNQSLTYMLWRELTIHNANALQSAAFFTVLFEVKGKCVCHDRLETG